MILTEIVFTVIGGLVAVGAALYKAHERSIPCNSRVFLVKKQQPEDLYCEDIKRAYEQSKLADVIGNEEKGAEKWI